MPTRRGKRAHLGTQTRLKGPSTGDAPGAIPLTRAGLEVPTDTAQAKLRLATPIEDERAPRRPPNARALRRRLIVGTLPA